MPTNERSPSQKALLTVATFALWIVTIVLGAYTVWVVLETAIRLILILPVLGITTETTAIKGMISVARWIVLTVGGIIWIIISIGGIEYHFKTVGQPSSWRLFKWTIGLELAVIVPLLTLKLLL